MVILEKGAIYYFVLRKMEQLDMIKIITNFLKNGYSRKRKKTLLIKKKMCLLHFYFNI